MWDWALKLSSLAVLFSVLIAIATSVAALLARGVTAPLLLSSVEAQYSDSGGEGPLHLLLCIRCRSEVLLA